MASAGLVGETQVMRQEEPGRDGPLGSLAVLRQVVPFEAAAVSDRLGWVGLAAARYQAGSRDDALKAAQRALELDPNDPQAKSIQQVAKAKSGRALKNAAAGAAWLQKGIGAVPDGGPGSAAARSAGAGNGPRHFGGNGICQEQRLCEGPIAVG
jgi:tetratricopeptide (TPR) repeat protein